MKRGFRREVEGWLGFRRLLCPGPDRERQTRDIGAPLFEAKAKVILVEEFQNQEGTDTDSREAMACLLLGNFKLRSHSSIFFMVC